MSAASALLPLVVSVPRGFGDLLAEELRRFGALDVRERGNTVACTGSLEVAYRVCLESWVASRVYLELLRFEAVDDAEIYKALHAIPWARHIDPQFTIACEWSGRHPAIGNTHYGTLRLKDAICDALRETTGHRPDVAMQQPGVRVHAHAVGTKVTVSLDLAGEGLHRRGWRGETGEAPLRENIAAGILLRAGWPRIVAAAGGFIDPLCGSGTLVIEAARMAAGFAANHRRRYFGFLQWRGHDAPLWSALCAAAAARAEQGLQTWRDSRRGPLQGREQEARLVRESRLNASYAGVGELCEFSVGTLADAAPPAGATSGLLCTNPPWGVRLGDAAGARAVHAELGRVLRERFQGWEAAVLTGDASLGLELGLRAHRVHTVWNGALECRLLRIVVKAEAERDLKPQSGSQIDLQLAETPGAVMFANRIRKNVKQLSAWLRREQVTCFRLYDADMPEYAFAIDEYAAAESGERWLLVQEYEAPREIPPDTVRRRRSEALAGLVTASGVPAQNVKLRTRRRVQRGDQYTKRDERREFHVVRENGLLFRVNFDDYLDTGLFLDHRTTRAKLREVAAGKRFLNLFAYTGTATVYAAAGGAAATTTVDLSATYLDWARANLALNGFDRPQHRREQADVREWLIEAEQRGERFDLIFCDPPTFSNSKRMSGVFDVQRDHVSLISRCMALLTPGGRLVFSTNAQRFKIDAEGLSRWKLKDVSRPTIPPDFARNTYIHQCFEIEP
ncbi:MAG: bifunctional 23S rRNA (guanine(2069)-N(7))-methyltransferase RlmK/23S rRNA (guanine(2445)-N(2))-methyltransferase RlmL [Sinobacteraceae bacterium]|nr:bifunctional 23S rRNA (guanine(2069)-N(7))-methyltransferase RlmK/23S rRNA (guanine(2445)-N(2))-methyltransferase RlmL [Nevskiaceae bacterium]